eukprot:scaffold10059_cov123-Isochrysis_galbana.AAC.13
MAGWPRGLAVCGESSGHPFAAEHKRGASRGSGLSAGRVRASAGARTTPARTRTHTTTART